MKPIKSTALLVLPMMFALVACGGGSTALNSTPAPAPTPTPTPTPTPSAEVIAAAKLVRLLDAPVAGDFAVKGVTAIGSPIGDVTQSPVSGDLAKGNDVPDIRYNASGYYEIALPLTGPSRVYQPLVPAGGDQFYKNALSGANTAKLASHNAMDKGYQYSELVDWTMPDYDFGYYQYYGSFAFGQATPAASVPRSGNATFNGIISGMTDVTSGSGASAIFRPASGTVNMLFDFGAGTLGGSLTLMLSDGMNPLTVGTYQFSDTIYSSGSTSYSGKFATNAAGTNFFDGLFTGPNANETIGRWALPFTFDGKNHQAAGAWIAKSH